MNKKQVELAEWLIETMKAADKKDFIGQIERDGKYILTGLYGVLITNKPMPVEFADDYPTSVLSLIDEFLCKDLSRIELPSIKEIKAQKQKTWNRAYYNSVLVKLGKDLSHYFNLKYLLYALEAVPNGSIYIEKGNRKSMILVKDNDLTVMILPVFVKDKVDKHYNLLNLDGSVAED